MKTHVKWARLFVSLLVLLLGTCEFARAQSSTTAHKPPKIEVRISVPKRTFGIGEPIPVRVEIHNRGEEGVFVGWKLSGFGTINLPYSLELWLEGQKGQLSRSPMLVVDCAPAGPNQMTFEDFIRAVSEEWVVVHPGDSYVTTVILDRSVFRMLNKPGRYRLRGEYSSSGMDWPSMCNGLASYKEYLRKLPYPSWGGKVTANAVWIQVVSEQDNAKDKKH